MRRKKALYNKIASRISAPGIRIVSYDLGKPDKLDNIFLVRSVEKQLYKITMRFFVSGKSFHTFSLFFFKYFVQLKVASKAYECMLFLI